MALASIHLCNIVGRPNMDQSPSQGTQRQRRPPVARSQSIKIRHDTPSTRNGHCKSRMDESAIKAWEEDVSHLEEQYEAATIQMYYRITDYRTRNSLFYSNNSTTPSLDDQFRPPLPSITMHNSTNEAEDLPATNATYISEENGAIFEMDL